MEPHDRPSNWTLVAYRTPASPSTARVSAWRGLHRLGALYLGPTVCLLPTRFAEPNVLETLAVRVRAGGGSFDVLPVTAFSPEAEASIRTRYSEARDTEYAEVVERAEALVAELAREAARGKYTFAEVEENEADLVRLRRWLRRVRRRDLFGASGRATAEAAVASADLELVRFIERAIAGEGAVSPAAVGPPGAGPSRHRTA